MNGSDKDDATAVMQRFEAKNGRAARVLVTTLAAGPLVLCVVAGLLIGMAAALPGLALAMLAAIPHWFSQRPDGKP